jgi:two-component sensor histidine kinase
VPIFLRAYVLAAALALVGLGCFYFIYIIRFESRRNYYTLGLMLTALSWIFSSVMEVADPNPSGKVFWYVEQYFSLIGMPPLWLAMSGHYCGYRKKALAPMLIPCFIISLALVLVLATNPLHGLFFRSLSMAQDGLTVKKIAGPAYFIYLVFLFVGGATGLFVIASNMRNLSETQRRRSYYVFVALAFPLLTGLVDIFWPEALGDLEIAPISALGSCAFLYLGMARWRLLNPLPMARSDFIDKLADPVVVMDESSRVLYANDRAKALALSLGPGDGCRDGLESLTKSILKLAPGQDACLGERVYKSSVKNVLDKGDKTIAILVSLNDVTELRNLASTLELKVQERTADLEGVTIDLEEEVEKVRMQEAKLKHSLEEKELLLREINHRVKNNLQVISSLIRLQAMRAGGQEARAALEACLGRVQAICLVHDRMYGLDHSLDRVDAGAYLKDIVYPLASLGHGLTGKTEVSIDGGGIGLSMDQAMNIGLIVNEAVTNAFKHVFKRGLGSRLSVRLSKSGDQGLVLCVEDDGPGIPAAGLDADEKQLGMSLIHSIAAGMDGEASFGPGPGGLLRVTMPRSTAGKGAKG